MSQPSQANYCNAILKTRLHLKSYTLLLEDKSHCIPFEKKICLVYFSQVTLLPRVFIRKYSTSKGCDGKPTTFSECKSMKLQLIKKGVQVQKPHFFPHVELLQSGGEPIPI